MRQLGLYPAYTCYIPQVSAQPGNQVVQTTDVYKQMVRIDWSKNYTLFENAAEKLYSQLCDFEAANLLNIFNS